MNLTSTFLSNRLNILLCLVTGLSVTTGCQDQDISLNVNRVIPYDSASCEVLDGEGIFLANGVLDLAVRQNYTVNLEVSNNLVNVVEARNFQPSDMRVSYNGVSLRSAVIEYSTLDQLSTGIPTKRVIPLSGSVPESTALVLSNFELFSPDVLEQIRNAQEFYSENEGKVTPARSAITILTRVRIKGKTQDGRDVESSEFLFPVELCNGCRIQYPADMLVQRGGQLSCPPKPAASEEGSATSGAGDPVCPSTLGTDDSFVDCQACQGLAVDSFARQLCQPPRIP